MWFMIPVYHTFKIADRTFPDSTEIDMNEHEQGNYESDKNMKKIGQVKTTCTEYFCRNDFRIHQRKTSYTDDRNQNVH